MDKLQITTPDIAYHADLIDAEVKQLQSRQFWMLNEALDVKALNKKLFSELTGCKELCETLNKDMSNDKARVQLLNETRLKFHEMRSKIEAALTEAKIKVQKKQQQLSDLERSEAKLAEEINTRKLHDAQAELQELELTLKTVDGITSNTKRQTEALISPFGTLETDIKTQNRARVEMLRELSAFREKKAALQQQCKAERDEIKALICSATDTKKTAVEKRALLQQLELDLVGLCANLKEVTDKREKQGVELDSLRDVLQVSEIEFSRIERKTEELQNNANVFEKAILEGLNKKNDLVKAKGPLDTEKALIEKQVSEMRKTLARKVEERKRMKSRVEDLIQTFRKLNKDDNECQRHTKEISRHEASSKANKQLLQSDLKRTSSEVQKLRENVSDLVREKAIKEGLCHQLQRDQLKFSEQEQAAKNELAIAVERLESTQRALTETKSKLRITDGKKVRFYVDNEIITDESQQKPTAVSKKKGLFRKNCSVQQQEK